ncbi:daunorubicin resistance protein DrrA family ABC transporter ATP-binding protein [Bacillus sp. J14TS2]|uniref:ABC transporter ATP-binding protein n=1 Tax=Bacillus sp. J14TS2 TaxID=2807188 RepID=UPI001B063483|nr:ABC transporter ATP-binding protein [Bacillus sp. J14TS2]GIN70274.1 daunorubicin resistance protein DrrA family ABC transporter ATP-binding protein [Bacillus sp. J14TS2]
MKTISIHDLNKAYNKSTGETFFALKNLNLEVEAGMVFTLLGPNGSGKTTTINMINGLNRPTDGDVKVMGLDPVKNMKKVRSLLSVVPQETALYNDLTAKENLQFHAQYYGLNKKEWHASIQNALNLVGLEKRQNDRVGTYSGGMQRRLALARALMTSPKLLLLDEPTLGVDVQSRNAIWNQIRNLAKEGKTVFLTTNSMEEAEALADHIMIIDHGKEIISGTPKNLKNELDTNTLLLSFQDQAAAKEAVKTLKNTYKLKQDKTEVDIQIEERKEVFTLMNQIYFLNNKIIRFEMNEPTLNDVFLHFTGRELRN